MIKIGLDMAQCTLGYAVRSGNNLKFDSLVLTDKEKKALNGFERVKRLTDWLVSKIGPTFHMKHELVIEGIYMGMNPKACLWGCITQGAFLYQYMRLTGVTDIDMPTALQARARVEDLRTRASKTEVQLYVIDRFKLARVSDEIRSKTAEHLEDYQAKKISSSTFQSRMSKVSTLIKKATGIDEHMADAVVLTL